MRGDALRLCRVCLHWLPLREFGIGDKVCFGCQSGILKPKPPRGFSYKAITRTVELRRLRGLV